MRVLLDESIPVDFAHAIGVVLIRARSNRIDELRPLVAPILRAVAAVEPGKILIVSA